MANVSVPVLNSKGEAVRQVEVPAAVSSLKVKPVVVHQAVLAHTANQRTATAHTKTRSEVAGGGKKPWKQKGTGRARHGSIRSPLWIGGGVTFGPRNTRNYGHRLPQQVKKAALAMVVADYLTNGRVVVVESFPQVEKTKAMAEWLKALKLNPKQKYLVLLDDSERFAVRAMANLPHLTLMGVRQLNSYDALCAVKWIVSVDTLAKLFSLFE